MHRVAAVVRPVQSTFELACATEVFGLERDFLPRYYEFRVCTERPGAVPTTAGYDMLVTEGLAAVDEADTVIIPGWRPYDAELSPAVLRALKRAHKRGCRLVTICTGAFALAQTGLLDGRRATTHWSRTGQLQALFPRVEVDPDVLYVDHGDVATSGGAGAGIDLCLHLVRNDLGAARAVHLARYMVLPPHREGGQTQYAVDLPVAQPDQSLGGLLEWASERLADPIGVEDMADFLKISPRTLARRFDEQLGTSPGRWLLTQRVNATRALLEETDLSVEAIARRVGLVSATNLRRRFAAAVRTTPAAYRRAFNA
ncbi:GlxA family transcriptional regulator [Kibdelosporangium phytohabitans]|uniref:AraC family transcriptional regulator n=1 Tax=Kibdelosporangium phytohabitans TaxID=860235 RepID=A0A0N9I4Q3_9PSEU|nr:helix-turn-helix domain-containing protein [Kibdelosporangium phytohabitans]ALG10849.1 AraC family transcriptional regulator [Kibdelosporangium phytohabitans]MBE1462026.1 AraC family transcriptional activator FtrA [Kibdelosporangium phytohabitans]